MINQEQIEKYRMMERALFLKEMMRGIDDNKYAHQLNQEIFDAKEALNRLHLASAKLCMGG